MWHYEHERYNMTVSVKSSFYEWFCFKDKVLMCLFINTFHFETNKNENQFDIKLVIVNIKLMVQIFGILSDIMNENHQTTLVFLDKSRRKKAQEFGEKKINEAKLLSFIWDRGNNVSH